MCTCACTCSPASMTTAASSSLLPVLHMLHCLMPMPDVPCCACCACCAVQVRSICEEMGIAFLGVGFDPKWRNEDVPRMPKSRCAGWASQRLVGGAGCRVVDKHATG